MSAPTCKCCRRWSKVGTNLLKLLLEGVDDADEDCGGGCTDTNIKDGSTSSGNSRMFPSLLPALCCNTTSTIQERKSSIPIQIRLTLRTNSANSHHGKNVNVNTKLLTYFPPLSWEDETTSSSTTTTAPTATTTITTASTISDFMQYVVEDLFIGNKEANFLVHEQSNFVSMLVGRSDHEETATTTMDISFRYGTKRISRLSRGEKRDNCTGQTASTCGVDFSLLLGETEELSPSDNAYNTFRTLLTRGNSSSKRLDLVLKAHVKISTSEPLPATTQETSRLSHALAPAQSTKRKSSSDDKNDGLDAKRSKLNSGVIRINGIPPALSEAWENQHAPPAIVNNNVGKSEDVVNVQHGRTNDAECTVVNEYIVNNAPTNDTEVVDAGEVGDESMHDEFADAENVDGDVGDKNMTVETSELNDQGDELSAADDDDDDSSSASSSSSGAGDESKDDVETIGKSSSEEDQSDTDHENIVDPSGKVVTAQVATGEDNSSESSSSSSSGSDDSSSSGSIDDDNNKDDDENDEILLSQSSAIAPTNELNSEVLITNLPLPSGKSTPSLNDTIYTQDSELDPTILFGDGNDAYRTTKVPARTNGKRVENVKASLTSQKTSSSYAVGEESDGEADKGTLNEADDKGEQHSGSGEKPTEKHTLPKTADDDKKDSSTSSSSSGSSSSSDSSSDSDTDTSSSSSTEDEGDATKAPENAPALGSIPPVVQSSSARGRRRTPLVSATRKIVIHASSGKR